MSEQLSPACPVRLISSKYKLLIMPVKLNKVIYHVTWKLL